MSGMARRDFMKVSAAAVVAGSAGMSVRTWAADDGLIHRNERPDKMSYTKLGRTNFMCSKLVFGCGAALMGGRAVRMLERAFEQGINHYDIGYDDYYKGSEKNFKEFAARHRDEIWITSKAPARSAIGMGTKLPDYTVDVAKADADAWSRELDKSLVNLGVEHVDAYYLMMIGHPQAMKSEELHNAFLAAKQAGKVGFWGISTHLRAHECLEAAVETGWYDLAMVAMTPGGWYDTVTSTIRADTGSLKDMQNLIGRAKAAGIGLVGMKAARHIALNPYEGLAAQLPATGASPSMFDSFYGEKLMASGLNPFQRSYAYLLANGMDVMNSDMQNFAHFEENIIAARDAHLYVA